MRFTIAVRIHGLDSDEPMMIGITATSLDAARAQVEEWLSDEGSHVREAIRAALETKLGQPVGAWDHQYEILSVKELPEPQPEPVPEPDFGPCADCGHLECLNYCPALLDHAEHLREQGFDPDDYLADCDGSLWQAVGMACIEEAMTDEEREEAFGTNQPGDPGERGSDNGNS